MKGLSKFTNELRAINTNLNFFKLKIWNLRELFPFIKLYFNNIHSNNELHSSPSFPLQHISQQVLLLISADSKPTKWSFWVTKECVKFWRSLFWGCRNLQMSVQDSQGVDTSMWMTSFTAKSRQMILFPTPICYRKFGPCYLLFPNIHSQKYASGNYFVPG